MAAAPPSTPAPKKGGGLAAKWKALPTYGKVGIGLVAVAGGYWLYKKRQANAAAAAQTAQTTATGSQTSPLAPDSGGGGVFPSGGGGGGGGFGSQNAATLADIEKQLSTLESQIQSPTPNPTNAPTPSPAVIPAVDTTTSASTGTNAVAAVPPSTPGTIGGTTADPGGNVPTVQQKGTVYSGIGGTKEATALANRGFTLYKNVNGSFVPADSPAGKASSNKGLYYNPAQTGVH